MSATRVSLQQARKPPFELGNESAPAGSVALGTVLGPLKGRTTGSAASLALASCE